MKPSKKPIIVYEIMQTEREAYLIVNRQTAIRIHYMTKLPTFNVLAGLHSIVYNDVTRNLSEIRWRIREKMGLHEDS